MKSESHETAKLTPARVPVVPDSEGPDCPAGVDFMTMPRPRTRFAEVSHAGLETIIEGVDADLGKVLSYLRGDAPMRNSGVDVPWDLCVFNGPRLVAVITKAEGRWPIVRMVEPAVGPRADGGDEDGGDDDA